MESFLTDLDKWGSYIASCIILVIIVSDKIKSHLKKKNLGKYIKNKVKNGDTVVADLLQKILELTLSDRARIFEFHNGGVSAGGRPFSHMSCTFEQVREGVEGEARNLQSLPTSWYGWLINKMVDGEVVTLNDIEEIKAIDPHTYTTLQKQDIKSIIFAPLKKGAYTIGFICVNYVREKVEITDEIKMELCKAAGLAERILCG